MDPVHDRGSMDPVHESGPWTWSKVGVHGPLVHVLSSPVINTLWLYVWQPGTVLKKLYFLVLSNRLKVFHLHLQLPLKRSGKQEWLRRRGKVVSRE